ncbi:Hsp20/alpha crystallin family protein [Pendulispora albinea]|uniref:Hsp20/alpha crystallin family protein n=1 Tax=Pendulispora albinea TaxID=2741071 RepID=A0ABZ2LTK4_9BACT
MFDYESFRRFDRVLDDVMGASFGTATHRRAFSPSIDVFSDAERVLFVCDLPGVKREDLELTVEGRTLTIRGARKFAEPGQNKGDGKAGQVLLGRSYGSFNRAFTLPEDLDVSRLTAELVEGVLTIRIPRLEASKPRRIAISTQPALAESAPSPAPNVPNLNEGK